MNIRNRPYLHIIISIAFSLIFAAPALAGQVGRRVGEIDLPGSALIVMIERGAQLVIAKPGIELRDGDRLSIIGDTEDIAALRRS